MIRVLAIAALVALTASCARPRYQMPSAQACEVYRAYWDARDKTRLTFVNDRTAHEYTLREEASAPTHWRNYDRGLREFKHDTSELFEDLRNHYVQSVHSCFAGFSDKPRAFGGRDIEPLTHARRANGDGGAESWNLSPVGFSADGNEAMLLQAIFCGRLCGNGQYVLFRKENGTWREIAVSYTWIS